MNFNKSLRLLISLGVIMTTNLGTKKYIKPLLNDIELIADFLANSSENELKIFSPLNLEIMHQTDAHVSSQLTSNTRNIISQSTLSLMNNVSETKENFFIFNRVGTESKTLFTFQKGHLRNPTKDNRPSPVILFQIWLKDIANNKKQTVEGENTEKVMRQSFLHFNCNLRNIFDYKKTIYKKFRLADNTVINRLLYVDTDIVNEKKFYVTILPYDVKNDKKEITRFLVHLIPQETLDLNVLWSRFTKFSGGDIKMIFKNRNRLFVKLYIPKIEQYCSQIDITRTLLSNGNKDITIKQNNILTIDEGELEAKKSFEDKFLCYSIVQPLVIKANKPHIAFVYDLTLDRILVVLKDTGLQ